MRKLFILFILLLLASPALAQNWSGVLSSSRAIDWSGAGVQGGIPAVTTSCPTATLGVAGQAPTYVQSTVTTATVNNAITACTSGSLRVILMNPGTYTLGYISFQGAPNVVLRGSGADQTLINLNSSTSCSLGAGVGVCMASSGTNGFGGDGAYDHSVNWTSGYTVGTTSITLSAVTGLQVGGLIFLDQTDDPSAPANQPVYSATVGVASTEGSSGNGRSGRGQQQPQIVTSISGTTVGISPGLRLPNIGSRTPQAWWNNALPLHHVGLENLSLNYTNATMSSGAGTWMFACVNCWVKGTRQYNSNQNQKVSRWVWMYQTMRDTVESNYFYGAGGSADGYGPDTFNGADNLVHNNISQHVSEPFNHEGCVGCVDAYNYSADDFYNSGGGSPDWQQNSQYEHAVGNAFILFEGNQYIGTISDNVHGGDNFNTIFRNYYSGRDMALTGGVAKTSQTTPVILMDFSRFANVIGNVLGKSGYHTAYQCIAATSSDSCNADIAIYDVGHSGTGGGHDSALANDPYAGTSLMRWGNYDTVNNAVRWVSGEVPSGLSLYANPVPASHTLPASFYLSGKPSWWGNTIPYPAAGPDVTGGNITGVGGYANLIPAANCYLNIMHGPINGTTGVLSFNADTCYPTGGTPTAATPVWLPGTGSYSNSQTGSLTCSTGSSYMCYTRNGTTPVTNGAGGCTAGTLYAGSFLINATETDKAVCNATGFTESSLATQTVTITSPPQPPINLTGTVKLSGNVTIK